jgi:hypothetical protein
MSPALQRRAESYEGIADCGLRNAELGMEEMRIAELGKFRIPNSTIFGASQSSHSEFRNPLFPFPISLFTIV